MEIYVSNLSYQTDDAALRELFAPFGEVRKAMVIKDRETGQSRGFGFVEMPDPEAAKRAVTELAGKSFQGRTMNASEARARIPGSGPGGGGSGGGYAPRPGSGPGGPSAPRAPYIGQRQQPPGGALLHPLGAPAARDDSASAPGSRANNFGEDAERSRRFSRPPASKDRNKRPGHVEDIRLAKALKGTEKGRRQNPKEGGDDDEDFIPPVRIR